MEPDRPFTVAFASCCRLQSQNPQPAWARIQDHRPDLLALLGDNVYSRTAWLLPGRRMRWWRWNPRELERRYAEQFREPNFRALLATTELRATWDDHDFGPDNARGLEAPAAKVTAARDLFHRAMNVSTNWPEIYCLVDRGPARFIFLDGRSYRDRPGRGRAFLGRTQERWLWNALEHDRHWTVVCSGSTVRVGSESRIGGESWSDYPDFLERFRERVTPAHRLLVLSGDIHRNHFEDHGTFFECTSSGVAHRDQQNFGVLRLGREHAECLLFRRDGIDAHQRIDASKWTATPVENAATA